MFASGLLLVVAAGMPAAPTTASSGSGLEGGPLTLTCGDGVYTRIFNAFSPNDGAWFAVYSNHAGKILVKWLLTSGQIATSDAAAGITMRSGDETAPGPVLSFATKDIGFYGSCGRTLGQLAPNLLYSGRLEGIVESVRVKTIAHCEILTETKISGGFLFLMVAGYGWIKAGQSARVVCATDVESQLEDDWLFQGDFTTTYVPALGTMFCWSPTPSNQEICSSPSGGSLSVPWGP